MNAHVSVQDLFRVLLPRGHPNGWFSMLSAYFDDSGTHTGGRYGASKIVLVGGIFGTEARLDSLDRNWKKLLDDPLCGLKPAVSRFHATECHNSTGEYLGWKRVETDHFWHRLQTAIIDSGVAAYGVAVARKDWDELVPPMMRAIWGDAEGMCIRNCFVRSLDWVASNSYDPLMTYVFDNRSPSVIRDAGTVFNAYQVQSKVPQLVGISFSNSTKIRLLQVADMIAWELYQHANDILLSGMHVAPRPQLRRLQKNMDFNAQLADRKSIKKIVDFAAAQDQEALRQLANHFTNFDPLNPDYSHLSQKPLS